MTADKEKRRAMSREAARRRRRVESDVFRDLCRLLPVQASTRAHLDKPSIIRLTLSYMRTHALLKVGHAVKYRPVSEDGGNNKDPDKGGCVGEKDTAKVEMEEAQETNETNMYLRILEGFLMVITLEGNMMFLSDSVSQYLGLTQIEMMGHNIFEFTHPCDHEEIRNNLHVNTEEVWCGAKREFVIRIKSALTHRGRSTNLKSATWKVLYCQGRAKVGVAPSSATYLLLTCQPLPLSHTFLSTHTFTSQHSMDMRFTQCDQRVTALLGYTPEQLLGRSIYEICHTLDTSCLNKNHVNLCLKSQSVSGQYRMLVRGGGYVWVESHSAVIPCGQPSKSRSRASEPLCILCVTYVLGGVEMGSLQLSLDQTIHRYMS